VVLPKGFLPLQHFTDYLKRGYYPFRDDNFERYIMQMVNTTIEVDTAQYADLTPATTRKLKRLLAIIAQAAPFKPNFTQIGGQLEVSRNNIADLCAWLEKIYLLPGGSLHLVEAFSATSLRSSVRSAQLASSTHCLGLAVLNAIASAGISTVDSAPDEQVSWYDLHGHCVKTPKKGLLLMKGRRNNRKVLL
jgi:hypothetical protein